MGESNPTVVFGLSVWVVAGIGVGVAVVLLLFLISICFFSHSQSRSQSRSRSRSRSGSQSQSQSQSQSYLIPSPSPTPTPSHEIHIHLLPQPNHPKILIAAATPEVSHLGWGHWYTLRELHNATNGFAHGNVIGEGGYGIVYYGLLHQNTHVAVKNLLNNRGQAEKEFSVEVEAIGRVRHKSLVRLIGFCAEGAQRMLVYEYVNNGNLEQWLHGEIGPFSPLTWDIRMKIILGMAKGLTYLHEGLEPKVVHRDIKPSNILLDRQWNAKVSDFGLAKLLCSDNSFIATRVMGTFGYVAPEYASTGMLTERSDVYSFGIIVMEIISGRQPVDNNRPPGEVNLVDWFRAMVADKNAVGVIDPKIQEKPVSRALKRALLVALRCVDSNALKRPKMGQLVHMLEAEDHSFRDDHKPVKNTQDIHVLNPEEDSTNYQEKMLQPNISASYQLDIEK